MKEKLGFQISQSVIHGPAIPDLTDRPQDSIAALRRAARTDASIRYLLKDNTEIVQPYSALWEDAAAIAAGLARQGCAPGRFVVLQLSSGINFIGAFWGCLLGGCVPVPVPLAPDRSAPLLAALELLAEPLLLTERAVGDRLAPVLAGRGEDKPQSTPAPLTIEVLRQLGAGSAPQRNALPPARPDDLALLLLTSGSTGAPKGVMLTQQNLWVSTYGMAAANRLTAADITLNWMPLEHVASLVMFHLTEVYLGCSQIQVENELVLKEPLIWLDAIDRYRVTATWAPNFAYGTICDRAEAIARRRWDLSSLRWMGNGAEAVVGKTTRRFLQLLAPHGLAPTVVSPGYGMSETCSGIVHSQNFSLETTGDDDPFVEVGTPIPGVSVRIADEGDGIVPVGTVGQLQVKGATVMAGYYAPHARESDPNKDAFTADGWLRTGDLGFLQNGHLTITGRQKETIVLNGANYHSHAIEAAVEELAEVAGSFTAACGVRRPNDASERLAIFFHPQGATADRLADPEAEIATIRRIRARVAEGLGIVPTHVIPVGRDEIPKTAIGKIQRRLLSQRFADGLFDDRLQRLARGTSGPSPQRQPTELEGQIAAVWQSVLGLETVGSHDNFFELGGTSLGLMQVLGHLQQLAPQLTALDLFQYPTVASLAAHVHGARHQAEPARPRVRTRRQKSAGQTEVAVIGMAGRFPGAANLGEFWQNLRAGVESVTWFADAELLASGIAPSLLQHPNYVKASPILDGADRFDAGFFDYSPREAELIDPQQRLLLECAWESLEMAGYDPLSYTGAIGLYAGASTNTYWLNHVYPRRHILDPQDPLEVLTLSSLGGFQMTIANDKDYLATRVSYKLNLRGPSVSVQTACSTSLVAIHLAAQSVLQGECDIALAGGVSVETPQKAGHLYQDGMILSPDGHCRAFDARAEGTIFGSGVGLAVLKPLAAAIADGDTIYAVIKGSAIGNDGAQKVGYLAPRSDGQAAVAAEALAMADVPADTIGYVEAHGTGTPLGDPIEVDGLAQAFRLSTNARQFCALGSVKTNVGHLNSASGIVGFMKTVLALHHSQIPPSLHFERPNPQIDFANSPFYVNTALTPWPQTDTPRRASVNSLGIGGTNAHIVLEAAPEPTETPGDRANGKVPSPAREAEIFTLAAKSAPALRALGQRYLEFLGEDAVPSLADLCFTATCGRAHFPYRAACAIDSVAQLRVQLQSWLQDDATTRVRTGYSQQTPPPLALLFPGQEAEFIGLGQELYRTQPEFRRALDGCAEILQTYDVPLLAALALDTARCPSGAERTAYAQPALFAVEYALAQLWLAWGIRPTAVLGCGVGEYVAACLAGVFSVEDALKLVSACSRLVEALPSGKMLAVEMEAGSLQETVAAYGGKLAIAAIAGPRSAVVSGSPAAIVALAKQLETAGIPYKPLPVSRALHSPLLEPILAEFSQVAAAITYSTPALDLVSTLTGAIADDTIATPAYWVDRVRQPIRFAAGLETLQSLGCGTFLNCGPPSVLQALGQAPQPDPSPRWLPGLHPHQSEALQLLDSLARLYSDGHQVNWDAVCASPSRRRCCLPTYPFERQRHWLDRLPQPPSHGTRKVSHPLLGPEIATPLKQRLFQQELVAEHLGFLADHQAYDRAVFPGAAYLEMALAAGATVLQVPALELRAVTMARSLVLDRGSHALQTVLDPIAEGGYRFRIYSRPQDSPADTDWCLHCEGTVAPATVAPPAPLALATLQASLATDARSPAERYQHWEQLGLQYRGAFRTLESLWSGAGSALGQIRIPAQIIAAELGRDRLHPALLDACFQTILAALPAATLTAAYVPVGVDRLHCCGLPPGGPGESVWSDVRLHGPIAANPEAIVADVRILDDSGRVLLSASGLTARRTSPSQLLPTGNPQPWRNWLYQIEWHPVPAPSLPPPTPAAPWLLVGRDLETLAAIAARPGLEGRCSLGLLTNSVTPARSAEIAYRLVDTDDLESFRNLLAAVPGVRHVVYCPTAASLAAEIPDDSDRLGANIRQECQGALQLLQAIVAGAGGPTTPQLWLVTWGAQVVLGTEPLAIAQSPLWGLGRTIAREHPELNCTCLDLDPSSPSEALDDLVAELHRAASNSDPDRRSRQISYRQRKRYEARLRPTLQQETRADATFPIPARSTVSSQGTLQLQIPARGTLENLAWQAVPRRPLADDEVEIQVLATGLNFRDVLNALGLYPGEAGPLGLECAGIVAAVGAHVDRLRPGDAVMAIAAASFGQFAIAPARLVVPQPPHLSPEEAATLPVAFVTASYALDRLGQIGQRHRDGSAKRILIHAAAGGVGQAAVQLARQAGAEIYATASPPKWEWLAQQGVRHIFNSRTLDFADAIWQQTGGQGVDLVLNSLSGETIPKSLSLLAPAGQFLEIGKVGIWSPERVARQRPDATYRIIDLFALTQERPERVQDILRSLADGFEQQQLQPLPRRVFPSDRAVAAFRFMQRGKHVGKVVVTPPQSVAPQPLIKAEATYLVTGGLGALGLRLVRWLADRGARHVLLLGRRSPSESDRQNIQRLAQAGVTVRALQGDLASLPELRTVLAPYLDAHTSPWPPLKGIFHLAGQLDDGILQQQTWERFETAMAAKVRGTWHLHQLTRALDLDCLVLFSSAASALGAAGQANYAAANGFLDAFAHFRRQEGLPALSINWGAWAETGLATSTVASQRLERAGLQSLSPETGLEILTALMTTPATQVGVLPGTAWIEASDPVFADLQPSESAAPAPPPVPAAPPAETFLARIRANCQDATADEQAEGRRLLFAHLRQQVATVLGIDAALLRDPQSGLSDLGIDSLIAVELRNRLQTSFDRPLPATLIYDYPTLAALTDYLWTLLVPAVDPDSSPHAAPTRTEADLPAVTDAEAQLREELERLGY